MEKKKTTKKPAAKKEVVKKEVINNEVTVKNQVDYTNLLSKIFYALVVIGVLLALNLCVNLIVNSKSNSNSTTKKTTTTTEDGEYDVSEFETLTTSELIDKIKDGGTQVVYIGRSTCGYCVKFLPIMKEAQNDLGFKTIYVNLEEISEDDANTLYEYDSFIEENFGYTPMVLVFKDGKFVKGTVGYTELDEYESFLKSVGIE